MKKTIRDYTNEEIAEEINRRYALSTKEAYERRMAITNHIRANSTVYLELADAMENENLKKTINDIVNYAIDCVDITIAIEEGSGFLKTISKNEGFIWDKYDVSEDSEQ